MMLPKQLRKYIVANFPTVTLDQLSLSEHVVVSCSGCDIEDMLDMRTLALAGDVEVLHAVGTALTKHSTCQFKSKPVIPAGVKPASQVKPEPERRPRRAIRLE